MGTADPSRYGSSWFAATQVPSPQRGRLTSPLDVDVCVVGGGLAGLTVAREVARRGWSVAVLEAQRIAWNASGRNTGFVLPGFAADTDSLIARVGLDHARSLWALSEAGADYVRDAATGMPGAELREGGWLHVAKSDRSGAVRQRCEALAERFGAAVEAWPAERVREVLRSPLYFDALHYPRGFSIHPLNYALGLAADAEAHGARIYHDTAALELDPVGVRKRIVTRHALVRAAHVVLAGNVHLSGLRPQFAGTLMPVYAYVIATAPLGDALREAVRYPGAVSDTEHADNHYRLADGERLIWAGRSTVWHGSPKRYVGSLLRDIGRAYPQLREVRAEYAWTGTLGHTVHRMPQIGEIAPGLWLLSGFGGHGLNTTAMGGDLVARAIVDGDPTWRLFKPFEMVWAGGVFGRVAQQLHYWSHRAQEIAEGWFAQRREARRRAADAPAAAPSEAVLQPAVPAPEPAPEPMTEPVPEPVLVSEPVPVPSEPAVSMAEPALPPPEPVAQPEPTPPAEERTSIVPEPLPVAAEPSPQAPPRRKPRKRKPRKRPKPAATLVPERASEAGPGAGKVRASVRDGEPPDGGA